MSLLCHVIYESSLAHKPQPVPVPGRVAGGCQRTLSQSVRLSHALSLAPWLIASPPLVVGQCPFLSITSAKGRTEISIASSWSLLRGFILNCFSVSASAAAAAAAAMDVPEPEQTPFTAVTAQTSKLARVSSSMLIFDLSWEGSEETRGGRWCAVVLGDSIADLRRFRSSNTKPISMPLHLSRHTVGPGLLSFS